MPRKGYAKEGSMDPAIRGANLIRDAYCPWRKDPGKMRLARAKLPREPEAERPVTRSPH